MHLLPESAVVRGVLEGESSNPAALTPAIAVTCIGPAAKRQFHRALATVRSGPDD
jgi:hypothetical protein